MLTHSIYTRRINRIRKKRDLQKTTGPNERNLLQTESYMYELRLRATARTINRRAIGMMNTPSRLPNTTSRLYTVRPCAGATLLRARFVSEHLLSMIVLAIAWFQRVIILSFFERV